MATRRHNEKIVGSLKEGDLIEIRKGVYSHWAVYVGDGRVVHVQIKFNLDTLWTYMTSIKDAIWSLWKRDQIVPTPQSFDHTHTLHSSNSQHVATPTLGAEVREQPLGDVCNLDVFKIYINNTRDAVWSTLEPAKIVMNALSSLGPFHYSLASNNCEHFAKRCRYGKQQSNQVALWTALINSTIK